MDIMSLIARLTLDAKEYEQALKKAERQGKSFKGDAEATVRLHDEYTAVITKAEQQAQGFKGNAEGTLTGHDKYTPEEEKAQRAADKFDGDEDGTLTGIDNYTDDVNTAQQAADNFDGDASGTLTGNDQYSDDVAAAQSAADGFNGDKDGTLTGVDNYTSKVETAQTAANEFDGDTEGTIKGNDAYTIIVRNAEGVADGFDGDVEGTITGKDEYSDDITTAQAAANEFDGNVNGVITGNDSYSDDITTAQAAADTFNGDVDGDIKGIDNYTDVITTAEAAAENFDGDAEGTATLDTTDYNNSLDEAETNTDNFEESVSGSFNRIKTVLTSLGIVAAINSISTALNEAIEGTANYADTVDKQSRLMSMSTQTYQVWTHVLQQSGTDMSALRRGWLDLTDAIDKAKNHQDAWAEDTGDLKEALKELDVNPANFETVDEMFDSIINKLAGMDSGTRRDNLVNQIFGRDATQLNALLDSGITGIQELKQEAYDLGLVMSDNDIAQGVAYGDAIANMNAAIDALKQNIAIGLFPLLTDAANTIASIAAFLNGRTGNTVSDEFGEIAKSVNETFAGIETEQSEVNALIKHLESLSTETGAAEGKLDEWKKTAERLVEYVPTLADSLNIVEGKFTDEKKALQENADAWYANARAKAIVTANQERLDAIARQTGLVETRKVDIVAAKGRINYDETIGSIGELYQNIMGNERISAGSKAAFAQLGLSSDMSEWSTGDYLGVLQTMEALRMQGAFKNGGNIAQDVLNLKGGISGLTEVLQLESEVSGLTAELEEYRQKYIEYTEAADTYLKTLQSDLNALPTEMNIDLNVNGAKLGGSDGEHAKGLNYVPYDGYVARLDRGETILNQAQAREYRSGGMIDADAIGAAVSSAITSSMAGMSVNMNGEQVGNIVTDTVSRNLAAQLRSRRY